MYYDKIYKQVDGVAMGSPLGPILANLLMVHLEKEWMEESFSPKLYYRYVDDIFCVFDLSSDEHKEFHNFLNTRHSNLKFTIEQDLSSIPFLEVNIEKSSAFCKIILYLHCSDRNHHFWLVVNMHSTGSFTDKCLLFW